VAAAGADFLPRPDLRESVMGTRSIKRVVVVALVMSATVLGTVEAAVAQTSCELPQCQRIELDAGLACEFPLIVDVIPPDTREGHVIREFVDNNGNPVKVILKTGRGSAITLTNGNTGATLSLPASGAPQREVLFSNGPGGDDDTSTFTTMGHLVLILFPTDVPAGPSTTLYVGSVVFDVEHPDEVFTLKETRGKSTDLCAVLSS
jgi:hypothetical protein